MFTTPIQIKISWLIKLKRERKLSPGPSRPAMRRPCYHPVYARLIHEAGHLTWEIILMKKE